MLGGDRPHGGVGSTVPGGFNSPRWLRCLSAPPPPPTPRRSQGVALGWAQPRHRFGGGGGAGLCVPSASPRTVSPCPQMSAEGGHSGDTGRGESALPHCHPPPQFHVPKPWGGIGRVGGAGGHRGDIVGRTCHLLSLPSPTLSTLSPNVTGGWVAPGWVGHRGDTEGGGVTTTPPCPSPPATLAACP